MPKRRLLGQLFPSFCLAGVAGRGGRVCGLPSTGSRCCRSAPCATISTAKRARWRERFAHAGRRSTRGRGTATAPRLVRPLAARFVVAVAATGRCCSTVPGGAAMATAGSIGSKFAARSTARADSAVRYQSTTQQRLLSVAVPIERDGQVIGVVMGVESLAELDRGDVASSKPG